MSGLEVSLCYLPQAKDLEFFVADDALEFVVLVLQLFELFRFVDADSAVSFSPVVDGLGGYSEFAGDVFGAVALITELVGFGEFPDDLFGGAVPSFLSHLLGPFPLCGGS